MSPSPLHEGHWGHLVSLVKVPLNLTVHNCTDAPAPPGGAHTACAVRLLPAHKPVAPASTALNLNTDATAVYTCVATHLGTACVVQPTAPGIDKGWYVHIKQDTVMHMVQHAWPHGTCYWAPNSSHVGHDNNVC